MQITFRYENPNVEILLVKLKEKRTYSREKIPSVKGKSVIELNRKATNSSFKSCRSRELLTY